MSSTSRVPGRNAKTISSVFLLIRQCRNELDFMSSRTLSIWKSSSASWAATEPSKTANPPFGSKRDYPVPGSVRAANSSLRIRSLVNRRTTDTSSLKDKPPPIDYREHGKIVVPPKIDLPPPGSPVATGEDWLVNVETQRKAAQKEKKDIVAGQGDARLRYTHPFPNAPVTVRPTDEVDPTLACPHGKCNLRAAPRPCSAPSIR